MAKIMVSQQQKSSMAAARNIGTKHRKRRSAASEKQISVENHHPKWPAAMA